MRLNRVMTSFDLHMQSRIRPCRRAGHRTHEPWRPPGNDQSSIAALSPKSRWRWEDRFCDMRAGVSRRFRRLADNSHVPQCFHALWTFLPNAGGDLDTDVFELVLEMGHGILGARIVPHDCFTKRLSGLPTPYNGSLALVRNACQSKAG